MSDTPQGMGYGPQIPHGRYRTFGGDGDGKVWAAPGTMLFIERMWGGRIQTITVDPSEVDGLIDTLTRVRDSP